MLLERSIFFRMKNKFLKKYLCITLAAATVLSGTAPVMAAQESDAFSSGEDTFTGTPTSAPEPTSAPAETPQPTVPVETPAPDTPSETPEPSVTPDDPSETPTPSVTPGNPSETPTPSVTPDDPSETPTPSVTPDDPSETPTPSVTPGNPSETPTPSVTPGETDEAVKQVVDGIEALSKVKLTVKHEAKVKELRTAYNKLTDEQKKQVTNYKLLVQYEKQIEKLKKEASDKNETVDALTDGSAAKTGTPVYYSSMVSNLHAGKEFYLDSLKDNYQLSFSDDFEDVMNQIEKEYKAANGLTDASDTRANGQTASSDSLLVRNWQDILAVYVYEQSQQGVSEYKLDASAKDALAEIFAELNPVIRDTENPTHASYGNYHINTYIKENNIAQEDREILKKYVETDCKLLCAIVTDAKGFIRQSVGDDVSEERVNVIAAAYSLVGEVGYFWGGKSTVIGDDPSWGAAETVSAAGSPSTGTTRAYGLDCSGFVTWSVINGYLDQSMQQAVGDGTSEQWLNANVVSEQEAQPGDLVFQRGPEAGSDNHVGIICGKTDAGDWIAVHCSSSKNGVTVGEAYGASFRYIRQPSFYPSQEELSQMVSAGASASNAEPVETVTDVSGTDTGSTDLNSGSEESILTGGNDTVADTDSIEVIFDDATDAGTAQETVTTDVSGSGSVEVTGTLQGILEQNVFVSQNTPTDSQGQVDFSSIEVSFQN